MRPVDLFHVAPPEAATTWVHRWLEEHPEIACPTQHEIHYFDVFYARGRCGYETIERARRAFPRLRGRGEYDASIDPRLFDAIAGATHRALGYDAAGSRRTKSTST